MISYVLNSRIMFEISTYVVEMKVTRRPILPLLFFRILISKVFAINV